MSLNRTIYVDLDDVLAETARAFLGLLKRHFKKTVSFEEIISFDLGISFGLNAQDYEQFMQLAHTPDALFSFEPMAGAADGLHALISLGYEVAVVTGRPPDSAEVSRAWLEEHQMPYHSLTFVDKYGRGGFSASNPDVITMDDLSARRFYLAIEDSREMAVRLASEMGLPVVLLDRPWNRALHVKESETLQRIKRCADWVEIVESFRRFD